MDNANKKGTHQSGKHIVVERDGAKVGQQIASAKGTEFATLTAARKHAKNGTAIVRVADGIVVSVR